MPGDFRVISPAPESVEVLFGAEAAPYVAVISTTLLRVRPPAYRGDAEPDTFSAVDVIVQNLDLLGNLIPGETVTSLGAYTYKRTPVLPPDATEQPYALVTRGLLRLLKRAVIKNVSHTVNTDFAAAPLYLTLDRAKLPALQLVGPKVSPDAEYTHEEFRYRGTGADVDVFDPPQVKELEYDIIGISDDPNELHSLMTAVEEVPERAPWLELDNPEGGDRLRHVIQVVDAPRQVGGASEANLHIFSMAIRVRGLSVYFDEPRDATATAETITPTVTDENGDA